MHHRDPHRPYAEEGATSLRDFAGMIDGGSSATDFIARLVRLAERMHHRADHGPDAYAVSCEVGPRMATLLAAIRDLEEAV
jgi:hypothetical protein